MKPTEESGKTGKIIYPSVETDGKREPAAWGKAPLKTTILIGSKLIIIDLFAMLNVCIKGRK